MNNNHSGGGSGTITFYSSTGDQRTPVQALNEAVMNFFMQIDEELNRNTIPLENQPDGTYLVPHILSEGNYQVAPNTGGAFQLIEPIQGTYREIVKEKEQKEVVIIRRIISYSLADKIINGGSPKLLLPVVTEMRMVLKNAKGFGPETLNAGALYGAFKRPGGGFQVFRDMENYAGYEIRLYSDCWEVPIEIKADTP